MYSLEGKLHLAWCYVCIERLVPVYHYMLQTLFIFISLHLNTGSSHALLMKKNEEEILPTEQDEKRQESESNARAQELINELLKRNEERHEEVDEERSQEEFPNYYKRHHLLTSKEKREDLDNERSQEEFPQKRHILLSAKEKREDQDEERSQEEFPAYEQKRHFVTSKEKRDDPDYDRSQEEFPSYIYKRYHDEDRGTEKRIWKPYKYHYKRYDDPSNEDFSELNSQEKRFEEEESAKQDWNPIQQYHHKQHHKYNDDSSDEGMGVEEKEKRVSWTRGSDEGSEESEEREKRVWKPSYKNHHMKLFHKQGKFENENDANLHHLLETSKRHLTEDEEDAEEKKQEKEAELRYLTKKRDELEERLLKEGEVYDKRNPWIYRGYYHPAWYKQSAEGNEGLVGPSQKLEELANALRHKMALLSEKESTEGEKAYLHQRVLTPEEVNVQVQNKSCSLKEYENS